MKLLKIIGIFLLVGCSQTQKINKTTPENLSSVNRGATRITGEQWQSNQIAHDDIVKVGLMLPLSGRAGKLGKDMKKAIEMALFQSKPKNIILKVYDTKSSEEGTRNAVVNAKKDDVEIVLGPVFSKHVKIVSDEINKPIFSFTTDTNVLGKGVYSFGMTLQNQIQTLSDNGKNYGKSRLGLLLPSNQNSKQIVEDLKTNSNLNITKVSYYPMNDLKKTQEVVKNFATYSSRRSQLKGQSRSVRSRHRHQETFGQYPYDMVFVGGSGADLEGAVSFLRYFEVNPKRVRYLGTSGWDKERNKTLTRTRAFVSGFNSSKETRFSQIFSQQYGYSPKNLAILAYDAMSFISHLAKDGSISRYEILDQNGFNGASGLFRFSERGTAEYGLEIRKLSPTEESSLIKSAPRKF